VSSWADRRRAAGLEHRKVYKKAPDQFVKCNGCGRRMVDAYFEHTEPGERDRYYCRQCIVLVQAGFVS
jgi:hypothetical protein